MPWVVSVLNEKGGVGKTTTCMSLAAVTAVRMQARVFLVDVDPQAGSSASWAERVAAAGHDLPFDFDSVTDVSLLAQIRQLPEYDIVFVDTPGSLENLGVVSTVVANSDYVIMPTHPEALAVMSLTETIAKVIAPTGIPYRVLLNRIKTGWRSDYQMVFADLQESGVPYFKAFIREYAAHSRAPLDGLVVTSYKRGRDTNNAIADYEAVAAEMFEDWKQIDAATASAQEGE